MRKVTYYTTRAVHTFIALFILFGWLIPNKHVLYALLVLQLVTFVCMIIFDGCIITRLESYLLKDDSYPCLMDEIFEYLHINIPHKYRMAVSLGTLVLLIAITLFRIRRMR